MIGKDAHCILNAMKSTLLLLLPSSGDASSLAISSSFLDIVVLQRIVALAALCPLLYGPLVSELYSTPLGSFNLLHSIHILTSLDTLIFFSISERLSHVVVCIQENPRMDGRVHHHHHLMKV